MFEEMVGWAVESGADLIIGETFYYAGEALAALEVAKASRPARRAHDRADGDQRDGRRGRHRRDLPAAGAGGADVVGMNCFRGPQTMLPWLRQIRAAVSCHVGALPIPVPDHRGRADVLQPQRRPRDRPLAARPHLPDRAGPAVREPLRDRCVRRGGIELGRQLPRRVLRRVADAGPPGRRGGRTHHRGQPVLREHAATTSCTATTSGCPSTSSRWATTLSCQPTRPAYRPFQLRPAQVGSVGGAPDPPSFPPARWRGRMPDGRILAFKVGGEGKPVGNPAWTRHCDRGCPWRSATGPHTAGWEGGTGRPVSQETSPDHKPNRPRGKGWLSDASQDQDHCRVRRRDRSAGCMRGGSRRVRGRPHSDRPG